MSRAERAKEYFLQGYACSQAVALAFADVLEIEKDTLLKIMLPYGGGMGRLRLTCGAVSGMAAIVGLESACGNRWRGGRENERILQKTFLRGACSLRGNHFGRIFAREEYIVRGQYFVAKEKI